MKLTKEDIFKDRIFQNTNEFRKSAYHFLKYGRYTNAPKSSLEYKIFWEEETRRCREGYTVGGLWITGKYYFYLNYIPMFSIPDAMYLGIHPNADKTTKTQLFPSFWLVDYMWWLLKELVKQNAESDDENINYFCHIVCLKTRRAGYSFKEAAEGAYNYTFKRGSKSLYYASTKQYLTSEDAIFPKVANMLNHINTHTVWGQKQLTGNVNTILAGYEEAGTKLIKGSKSLIKAVVLDDPNKARGGDAIKVTLEEFGSFPGGLEAWDILLPQVRQGGVTTGFMTAFGTGGGSNKVNYTNDSMEALESIFYDPESYFCIAFPNIWDEGLEMTECGFFVPANLIQGKAIDADGNVDKEMGKELILKERMVRKNAKSIKQTIAENPLTPTEALERKNYTEFPVKELTEHRARILANKDIQGLIKYGKLFVGENEKIEFRITNDKPFMDYPVRPDADKKPCIVIYQNPIASTHNYDRGAIYKAVLDPVTKDVAPSSSSVFACYIYKKEGVGISGSSDRIVASLVGRYSTREEYYKELFMLLEYYNAKLQSETGGGGDAIIDFAKKEDKLEYLEYELLFDSRKEIDNHRNRSYFIDMTTERKKSATLYLIDWLIKPRGFNLDNPLANKDGYLFNYSYILDEALLKELVMLNDVGNFDRFSALLLIPLVINEDIHSGVEIREKDKNNFFNRPLYSGGKNTPTDKYLQDI